MVPTIGLQAPASQPTLFAKDVPAPHPSDMPLLPFATPSLQLCKSKFGAGGKAVYLAAVDEARSSCPMRATDPCDPACKAALQAVSQSTAIGGSVAIQCMWRWMLACQPEACGAAAYECCHWTTLANALCPCVDGLRVLHRQRQP